MILVPLIWVFTGVQRYKDWGDRTHRLRLLWFPACWKEAILILKRQITAGWCLLVLNPVQMWTEEGRRCEWMNAWGEADTWKPDAAYRDQRTRQEDVTSQFYYKYCVNNKKLTPRPAARSHTFTFRLLRLYQSLITRRSLDVSVKPCWCEFQNKTHFLANKCHVISYWSYQEGQDIYFYYYLCIMVELDASLFCWQKV